jgi:hypothetical protein
MEGSSMRKSQKTALRRSILMFGLVILLTIICIIAIPVNRFRVAAEENNNQNIQYITYVVHAGDTLWSIADTYMNDTFDSHESYISEVKRANRMDSFSIYEGQLILIPCDSSVCIALTAAKSTSGIE